MPRICTICRHLQRDDIDTQLLDGSALRTIADQWSVSKTALIRHRPHLSSTLLKAQDAAEISRADTLLNQLESLKNDVRRIQGKAEAEGNYRAALAGIRELVRIVDLVARLRRAPEGNETNILNLNLSPDIAARMAEMYLARRKALNSPQ